MMRFAKLGCFRSCSWCLWKALDEEGCMGLWFHDVWICGAKSSWEYWMIWRFQPFPPLEIWLYFFFPQKNISMIWWQPGFFSCQVVKLCTPEKVGHTIFYSLFYSSITLNFFILKKSKPNFTILIFGWRDKP